MESNNGQPSTSGENNLSNAEITNSTINQVTGDIRNTTIIINPEKETIPSVKQLKQAQQKYEEECFLFDIDKTTCDNIQNIFPKMVEVPLSNEDRSTVTSKEKYTPSLDGEHLLGAQQSTKELKFHDILGKTKQSEVLNVIGLPGQGKSTFCKRAVKSFCNDSNALCLLVKFMNLNFNPPDEKLTLQELLIDNNYPNLKPNECKSAFEWICENEENLLLIFDGYDQAKWSINPNAPKLHYSKPQPVCDLVSNIINKKYLPKSRVIITSRPHAIKTLPERLQQNFTVQLLDLSYDDMKSLFFTFAGSKANELWNMLHTNAPQLISLCGSPLILQLVIKACIDPRSNVASITTMTRLFSAVLDHLNVHAECKSKDIRNILPLLTKLAFIATLLKTVTINEEDVIGVGLDVNLIRHLIISQQIGGFCHLFEGKEIFYFIHQTLQEYLTALYISKYMSDDEFRRFIETDLFTPHWAVVRRFMFGIIFDLYKNTEEQQWKPSLMKEKLLQKIESYEIADGDDYETRREKGNNLVGVLGDVRECADEEITEEAARLFPTNAVFDDIHFSNSDAHAVSLVLRKVKTKIQYFRLYRCRLNSQTFSYFVRAIKYMEGSIDHLDITFNKLTSDDVDEICDILSKINDWLVMWGCFVDVGLDMEYCFVDGTGRGRAASEEEKAKILAKQGSLGHSNLRVRF